MSGLILDGIKFSFRGRMRDRQIPIIDGASLTAPRGTSIALVGRSGSGKSTLLNLAAGILLPTAGTISLGEDVISRMSSSRRRHLRSSKIGMIHQNFALVDFLTAVENIQLPGIVGSGRREVPQHLLEQFGLAQLAHHTVSQLSGGQQQRVAIVRALHQGAELILADEPTSALDPITAGQSVDVLRDTFCRSGGILVIATHDAHLAAGCEWVGHLADGRLVDMVQGMDEAGIVGMMQARADVGP